MSITFKELLGSHNINEVPLEHQHNGEQLLKHVNIILAEWGKPVVVTSGYRSLQDHIRIYSEKASKEGKEFDPSKVPMKSRHLFMQAVDLYDPNLELTQWLKDNPAVCEKADIYMEEGNKNWVHCQYVPFGSYKPGGTRWFKP